MNVGILTFHNAHNYGAALQAYALKRKLTAMGHEAHIVNYRNAKVERNYQKQLKANLSFCDLLHPSILKYKVGFMRNIKTIQNPWDTQWNRFEEFINTYLVEGSCLDSTKEIAKKAYDALIVGSDQVWSSQITGGLDPAYLLDFDYSGRKISYAASISGGKIPLKEKEVFSRALRGFDYLSVRERTLADSIRQNYGLQVFDVLDPTLLLEAQNYEPLFKSYGTDLKDYLFAYYVVEDSEMDRCAAFLSKKKNIKRIGLHYYMKKEFDREQEFADFGPIEFLNAIRNAKMVVTNSFHGTVFSILFQKEFYSVCRDNARIWNLLDALGLNDREVEGMNDIDLSRTIDYGVVQKKLKKYRKESEAYLCRALEAPGIC